jgi:hypothetical protein
MMTAAQIAKELGLAKIQVNYLYREWMSERIYESNPLEDINVAVKEDQHLV